MYELDGLVMEWISWDWQVKILITFRITTEKFSSLEEPQVVLPEIGWRKERALEWYNKQIEGGRREDAWWLDMKSSTGTAVKPILKTELPPRSQSYHHLCCSPSEQLSHQAQVPVSLVLGQTSYQGKGQAIVSILEIAQRFPSEDMTMSHFFMPEPQPLSISSALMTCQIIGAGKIKWSRVPPRKALP